MVQLNSEIIMIKDHLEAVLRDTLDQECHMKEEHTVNGRKTSRVCTEWRRLRSRVAARGRREQESRLFGELMALLPPNMAAQLDKTSVIRLTIACLRLRALLDPADQLPSNPSIPLMFPRVLSMPGSESAGLSCEERLLDAALGGFLLLLSLNGQVIFTTNGVTAHTGINQMDLIGRSLFDFMHPCDQKEVKKILTRSIGNQGRQECDAFFRIRSVVNQKMLPWKVIHCTGVKKPSNTPGSSCLVLLCRPMPIQNITEMNAGLNYRTFLSIHRPDMRFSYCHSGVLELTGFSDTELFGQSVYQYYHSSDCQGILKAHLSLFSKGHVSTGKYRLLLKHGGYVWAETEASVVYDHGTGQPESVICVNYILSEVELPEVVFSLQQTERLLKPTEPFHPEVQPNPLPPAAALQNEPGQAIGSTASLCSVSAPSHANTSPVCDLCELDLDTLAPYIPMDGEDFLLTYSYDGAVEMPESSKRRPPGCPLSQLGPDVQGYLGTASKYTVPTPIPLSMCTAYQKPPNCGSVCTHRPSHSQHGTNKYRDCVESGLELKRQWSDKHLISIRQPLLVAGTREETGMPRCTNNTRGERNRSTNVQCDGHALSLQREAHQRRKGRLKVSKHPYQTHRRNCEGSRCLCCCGSLTWSVTEVPGHTEAPWSPAFPLAQHPSHTPSLPFTLPVLSQWECEVNAPLGPTSYLLNGTEIASVLDHAVDSLH